MAEHEKASQKRQEQGEQKKRQTKQNPGPFLEAFHGWDEGYVSIGETPFWPQLEQHTALMTKAKSDEQRASITLQLQHSYGNRYVQRLLESVRAQAKLTVNDENDTYEQEANSVAHAVSNHAPAQIQRQEEEEEEEEEEIQAQSFLQRQDIPEEELQTKSVLQRQVEGEEEKEVQTRQADFIQRQVTNAVPEVNHEIEGKINAARGSGEPLDDNTREPMEQAFGADFSGVRVHTDSDSDAMNQSLQARAFTTGQDIFFRSGEYDPSSSVGQQLLAHELTHTLQQGASSRISRAETRMVTKKTFLRKPDKWMDSPTKRKFKPALMPKDAVEMLDQKSPSEENPKWQLARDLKTGNLGFVRLSKVMGIEAKTTPDIDKAEAFTDIVESLAGIIGGVGGLEGIDDARKTALEGYVKELWAKDPDKVKQLANISDPATPDEIKEAASKEWESQNPDIVNTTRGIMFGGLGVGIVSDVLGGFGGLVGMVQGIAKFFGPEAKAKDKWEAVLATGKGGTAALTSALGATEKTATIVGEAAGEKTLAGEIFKGVAGTLGIIGSAIKTVKGCIDTLILIFKGIIDLVKKAKKGIKTKTHEVIGWFADFFSTIGGTLNGALKTAIGVLKMLKAIPVISQIMGIVGSVITLITAGCDAIKNGVNLYKWVMGMKKSKETMQKIEDEEYIRTERNMGDKLRNLMGRPSMPLRQTKEGKPELSHIEEAMSKYEKKRRGRSKDKERDYRDAKQYRLDRDIIDNLKKRVMRGLSRIPEFVLDGLADAVSIVGALVSVGADIAALALSPTGIGAGIAKAVGVINGVVTGVVSGFLKLSKTAYTIGRGVVRWIKGKVRGKKWQTAKQEKRKWDTITLMQMVARLQDYDPSEEETKAAYERAQLRLEATGVDLKELYGMNDKPEEQAKMIYKALAKRE